MKIIITGAAGFIGSRLCLELTKNPNNKVYGIDNLDSYYSIELKKPNGLFAAYICKGMTCSKPILNQKEFIEFINDK